MSAVDRTHEILHRRALALARSESRDRPVEPGIEVIEFALGYERYAFEMEVVSEVFPFKELSPLPCVPPHITGIVNVRGRILAVVDLKKFFGLPEPGIADLHEMIIVKTATMELGILVDYITGSKVLPLSIIQPPPPALADARRDYLRGIAPGPLAILDIVRLLDDPRMIVNDEVPA